MSTFIVIAGTVADDPRENTTGTGKKVASFRVDTGHGWWTCNAWEALAEQVPEKGEFVIVTGSTRSRSYENKDKQTVWVTECSAQTINVVNSVEEEPGPANPVPADLVGDLNF